MYKSTYKDLLAAVTSTTSARITCNSDYDTPKNCAYAWSFKSRRGWYAMSNSLSTTKGMVPLLVGTKDNLYICEASAKLAFPNTFTWMKGEKRINRKGYFLITEERLVAMSGPSYFSDGTFSAKKSTHTCGDTLDIIVAILGIKGQKETVESVVARWTADAEAEVVEMDGGGLTEEAEEAEETFDLDSLDKLSIGALKTFDALIDSSGANGHDFGFMDEALEVLEGYTAHQFAGFVSHLSKIDIIAYSEDLSDDKGIECNEIQFAFHYVVIDNINAISERVTALIAAAVPAKPAPKATKKAKKAAPVDTTALNVVSTKTFKAQDREVTVNVHKNGTIAVRWGTDSVSAASVIDVKLLVADHFSGRSKGIIGKWITLTHRKANS